MDEIVHKKGKVTGGESTLQGAGGGKDVAEETEEEGPRDIGVAGAPRPKPGRETPEEDLAAGPRDASLSRAGRAEKRPVLVWWLVGHRLVLLQLE